MIGTLAPNREPSAVAGPADEAPAFIVAAMALTELPHFLMERRMLLGIKQRAESVER